MVLTVALGVLSLCGCRTVGFYTQALNGEASLLIHEQKVDKILADPKVPAELKERLRLARNLCRFAKQELGLPGEANYRKYVDVHRRFVVWNVEAAPEFSLAARTWWYPFLGSLTYRGYFSEAAARDYAQTLEHHGFDVYVGGVPAYSTLGWFKDPLLNTFLGEPEPELAETIIHELAHQRVFASGDTDFNEAFATAVGEEGARRWLNAKGDASAFDSYQASLRRTRQFARLVGDARGRLIDLYGDERRSGGKVRATAKMSGVPRAELRRRKADLLDQLRRDYVTLKAEWGGNDEYDAWFAGPLNNAVLNSVATYYDLVPGFERMLADAGGDLNEFYRAVERLARLPEAERHHRLELGG